MFLKKSETYAKVFFIISLCGLKIYALIAFYSFHNAFKTHSSVVRLQDTIKKLAYPDARTETEIDKDLKLRFILIWSGENETNPINYLGEGQEPFKEKNCTFSNCIVTIDKKLLDGDYTKFDAVVINVTYLKRWKKLDLPQLRSQKQKYIFYGMLAAEDYPVCNAKADDYFNWTWSYKLYSDVFSPFIEVKSLKGNVVAPSIDPKWENHFNFSLGSTFTPNQTYNTQKPKAVAWIMNKCGTRINRLQYVKQLKLDLRMLNRSLDIYGCGNLKYNPKKVNEMIRKNYYFYLVFEDSLSEDYVTTEILKAYDNHVLPIVISGADLSRFLPPKAYINARDVPAERLAARLDYMISNPVVYNAYQKWRDFFTVEAVERDRGICDVCKLLNNDNMINIDTHYEYFRKWWYNGPMIEHCYPKGAEKFSEVLSYLTKKKKNT